MTRDYLESMGVTDEELDRLYGEYFGGGPRLVGDDGPELEIIRAHRWREVGIAQMGGFRNILGREPLGAFAENDPEAHERNRG